MELFYLKQVIEGNASSFSYFIGKYKDMAFSIAYRITGNREDAEEAVQDGFLKAYKSIKTFRQDAKFSTWLYKIVVNAAINKTKRKKIFAEDIDITNVPDMATDSIEAAYASLENEQRKKIIDDALGRLQMEDRLLLTLYYLNENSIEEITMITDIKVENVKMKLHRARKKMYVILEKKLHGEIKNII